MALRQHALIIGRTPADVGGQQPTFSRGVAFRYNDTNGGPFPAGEYSPEFLAAARPLSTVFARLTTADGSADRRELVKARPSEWRPGVFGEGSRIEYADASEPPGTFAVLVEVVDHLWEAGLPGPCPCGVPGCGNFK